MNRRDLKKEINFVVNEFAEECLSFMAFHEGEKADKADTLIDRAAGLLDSLIFDINHHSNLEGKDLKNHFIAIDKKMETEFGKIVEDYNALVK
jgi:hypothetical protein